MPLIFCVYRHAFVIVYLRDSARSVFARNDVAAFAVVTFPRLSPFSARATRWLRRTPLCRLVRNVALTRVCCIFVALIVLRYHIAVASLPTVLRVLLHSATRTARQAPFCLVPDRFLTRSFPRAISPVLPRYGAHHFLCCAFPFDLAILLARFAFHHLWYRLRGCVLGVT